MLNTDKKNDGHHQVRKKNEIKNFSVFGQRGLDQFV